MVTALLLLMVTAAPAVGVIEPALVILMSAGPPALAVEVTTGVVWAAPMVTVAVSAGVAISPNAIGVRQVVANR